MKNETEAKQFVQDDQLEARNKGMKLGDSFGS